MNMAPAPLDPPDFPVCAGCAHNLPEGRCGALLDPGAASLGTPNSAFAQRIDEVVRWIMRDGLHGLAGPCPAKEKRS